MKRTSGVTLIELLIACAIVGIGILAFMSTFRYVTTSIQISKGKSLANNLVTEQIEKLKNLQYYSLLVTTSTYSDNRFTPPLLYDNGSYPAQAIIQGGISFTRGTRIDFAYQYGNTITTAAWTSDDTGLKLITVYVMWQDNFGLRYQAVQNLMANPAANPLNSTFKGTVNDTNGNHLVGAVVKTIDNPNYYAITDASGNYQFKVASGTYTLNCANQGYFSSDRTGTASVGTPTTINFNLAIMSTGTVNGHAYIDSHIVVSQVVASTDTGGGTEYVELYNPTTSAVTIGSGGTPSVNLYIFDRSNTTQPTGPLSPVPLTYVNSSIPSHGYYLIANATTVHVLNQTIQADAYYTGITAPTHLIAQAEAGGLGVADLTPNKIDSLSWSKTGSGHNCPATPLEGSCIPNASGLQPGEQLVRYSDPASLTVTNGRAYDTDNNSVDIDDIGVMTVVPGNSLTTPQNPTTGTPAAGAYVTCNDPLSSASQCDSTGYFTIPGIATGTWTLAFSSSTYYLEEGNVQMTPNLSTGVPNGSTTPAWPAINLSNALINDTTAYAFISGVVTDINNNPIPNLQVLAGGKTVNTNSSGRYFVSTSTGDVLIVANNGNQNKAYASQSNVILGTIAGAIYDNPPPNPSYTWFTLSTAGTLVGYFQTGSSTALPGQTAVALQGGNQVAQAVSDNSGHFYLANLSTGTYTITPSLDPASSVSPTSTVVTLTSTGTATSVSTFTVTNGLALISGQVLKSTNPITTGVLILASTTTLTGGSTTPPPTMNGGLGTLCNPCYYGVSSDATGEYTLYVRSSASSYQLYGWYTAVPGSPTSRLGPFSVAVSTAGMIATQNLSW